MYAIVDVETTGGQFGKDRITEIAVYVYDGEKITQSYNTLINPKRPIDPYVVKLTHITDQMVANSPTFEEVADDVLALLQKNIFVAHNVRFDYGIIQNEYRRLGIDFRAPLLDTVNLARKAFPGHSSYSLGTICEALAIPLEHRHRAHGDALATVYLFEKILATPNAEEFISLELNQGLDPRHLPPLIKKDNVILLPESAGLLFFYNSDKTLLYVEPTKNILKCAIQFFNKFHNDISRKEWFQTIANLDFELTGNELIAKLNAHDLVNQSKPLYNKAVKHAKNNFAISFVAPENATLKQLKISRISEVEEQHVALKFPSKSLANKAFQKIMQDSQWQVFEQLLAKISDEENWLKQAQVLNSKVELAIKQFMYKYENFVLLGNGISPDQKSIVWIKNNQYIGSGFIDRNSVLNKNNVADFIKTKGVDDPEIHKIIRGNLRKGKKMQVINLV